MRRILVVGAIVVVGLAAITGAHMAGLTGALWTEAQAQEGARTVTLKLALPQDDTKVSIDGKEVKGDGAQRSIEHKVAAGKETVTVTAFWEPNNYTEITRKKTVKLGKADEISVDLTKVDQKEDIVVRFVPTPDDVVDAMCRLAKIGPNDIVYDLGCGDGRMVITAVKKFGAKKGIGIDIREKLVKESTANAKKAGVDDKVEFRQGDVLKVKDLADATVVMLYMGEDINQRLRPILQSTLKPGARVVSHRFTMGDWEPVKTETVDSKAGYECRVLLWEIKPKKEKE